MNIKIILFAFTAAALGSCSTAYKSGQTPDDLYFSPARPAEVAYHAEPKKEVPRRYDFEESEIRMSAYDPRWRNFNDDYNYAYDPYRYGYTYGYYYNPYYCPAPVYFTNIVISNPKNSTPRMTSLGSYNNTRMYVPNQRTGTGNWMSSQRPYNVSNSNTSLTRRTIVPAYNNNTYSRPDYNSRTYTPSSSTGSSSGSSGSSSGGGGGSVSRPGRGH